MSLLLDSPLATLNDIVRMEAVAWRDRIPAVTTYELLKIACEHWNDRIALRLLLAGNAEAPTRDVTYTQLLEGIHRTANALYACGVKPNTPIAILLPNLIEGHFSLWGAQAAGIASPINPMLESAYIARICRETGAEVLISLGPVAHSEIWGKAVQVANEVDTVHTIFAVDLAVATGQPAKSDVKDLTANHSLRSGVSVHDFHSALAMAEASRLIASRDLDGNDICAYFHTGGTTGYPKVAVHRHENEAFLAWAIQSFQQGDQVILSGLPLFHVNGALVTGLSAFLGGAEVVLLTAGGYRTPGLLDDFWKIARRFSATTFSAVPTILAALSARALPQGGVPSLRHVFCGAAQLPMQVALDFERVSGARIHEGYGLTEGTCVTTLNPPLGERRLGTVGLRIPYQEITLFSRGSDGRLLAPCTNGQTGVVAIRGPNVFPGYLRESDNLNIWHGDGWFNTGDLGRMDADGYLTLCGRAKDLIIRAGHNIDPLMIEEALSRCAAVAGVAAIGQPDLHAGELPIAFVSLKPDALQTTEEELLEFARQEVPERAAVPVRVVILAALPLTAINKIDKPQLRILAVNHVLREALQQAGLNGIHVHARQSPEQGLVVDISGEKGLQEQALALVGAYPVKPYWQDASTAFKAD